MSTYDQAEFDVRCEWGIRGVEQLAPISDALVIVDVFSFSTCVDIVTSRGASVYPYRAYDASAEAFAASVGAILAGRERGSGFSLSPSSLLQLRAGTRLVLPSPNGASLTLAAGSAPVVPTILAGGLRNARAVAEAAARRGRRIAVIPAGERWPDGSLRPAFEDLVAAGAIVDALPGTRSPEALVAVAAFYALAPQLGACLRACSSGRELIERGFADDVDLCAALNVSGNVPIMADGAYVAM